jgi:hypothetical protein
MKYIVDEEQQNEEIVTDRNADWWRICTIIATQYCIGQQLRW